MYTFLGRGGRRVRDALFADSIYIWIKSSPIMVYYACRYYTGTCDIHWQFLFAD